MRISLNFLDRWEYSIFEKYNGNHVPISKSVATYVLVAAGLLAVVIFIMSMAKPDDSLMSAVIGIICGVAFLLTAYKTFRQLRFFTTTGSKIGYAAYVFALFCVLMGISVYLAMIVLLIVLTCLFIWAILKIALGGGSSKGKRIRVHYNDGTSEEMEEDGRGIMGENYYRNKNSGNTHVEY